MKKQTLFFVLFLPFFAAAQTVDFADRQVVEETSAPALPPALGDGPELFRRGVFEGWRKKDSVLVEPIFSKIEPFYSSKMVAKKGKIYGLIDERGREIVPFEFDKIEKFRWRTDPVDFKKPPIWLWLRVSKNGKMGLLDSLGQPIALPEFGGATWSANDTTIIFSNRGRQVFVSQSGKKPHLETRFDSLAPVAMPVRGFFAPVLTDGKTALASLRTGKIEFENVEIWSPAARADFLKTRPDLPKNREWVCRARRPEGQEVLIEPSGEIFQLID